MATITIEDGVKQPNAAPEAPPPELNLHFPQTAAVQPEGFEGLALEEAVIVTVRGKVIRVSNDQGVEWGGKGFAVAMESCVIEAPGRSYNEQRSLGEAVDRSRRYIDEEDIGRMGPGPGV